MSEFLVSVMPSNKKIGVDVKRSTDKLTLILWIVSQAFALLVKLADQNKANYFLLIGTVDTQLIFDRVLGINFVVQTLSRPNQQSPTFASKLHIFCFQL